MTGLQIFLIVYYAFLGLVVLAASLAHMKREATGPVAIFITLLLQGMALLMFLSFEHSWPQLILVVWQVVNIIRTILTGTRAPKKPYFTEMDGLWGVLITAGTIFLITQL